MSDRAVGQRAGEQHRNGGERIVGRLKTRSQRGWWLRRWSCGAPGAVCGQHEGWRVGDERKARTCGEGLCEGHGKLGEI